jgi:hypothetical protein
MAHRPPWTLDDQIFCGLALGMRNHPPSKAILAILVMAHKLHSVLLPANINLSPASVPRFAMVAFMLGLILLIVLVALLLGSVPAWPYSRGWGYYPSGGLGLVLVVVLVLVLMRYI